MEGNNDNRRQNMSQGYVRVFHAVPNAPNVDVYANDTLIAKELEYGVYTDYIRVPARTYKIDIYATGTKEDAILSSMLTVNRNDYITTAAAGMLDMISLLAIRDGDVPRNPQKALIRFIHLSPDAPAVDITLPDGTILFRNVSFKRMTPYIAVDQMSYTLQVRVTGTDQVVLTVPDVDVRNNNYYSVYAIGLVGERPELAALLLEDE